MATILGKRDTVSPTQSGGGMIPHTEKARPPFFFMTHPRSWSYVPEEGVWLPRLKRHRIDPGVNSITSQRNPATAYTEREQHGFTVIKPMSPALGEFRGYVQRLPYAGNGTFCLSIFETVEVMPGGHVFIEQDAEEFARFRRFVIDAGIVPPLDARWKAVHLREMKKTLNRKASTAANAMPGSPAHDRLKAYQELYDAAEKAPIYGAKPKKTRKPRTPKPQASA
jgi:hypothetical protein